MAATPPREKIDFRRTASPFMNSEACTTQFSVLQGAPKHYGTTGDNYGLFYRNKDVSPASRIDGDMVRAPMPSAFYVRPRAVTAADEARPSVSLKAPAAFPRLNAGMAGTVMRTPGVNWANTQFSDP